MESTWQIRKSLSFIDAYTIQFPGEAAALYGVKNRDLRLLADRTRLRALLVAPDLATVRTLAESEGRALTQAQVIALLYIALRRIGAQDIFSPLSKRAHDHLLWHIAFLQLLRRHGLAEAWRRILTRGAATDRHQQAIPSVPFRHQLRQQIIVMARSCAEDCGHRHVVATHLFAALTTGEMQAFLGDRGVRPNRLRDLLVDIYAPHDHPTSLAPTPAKITPIVDRIFARAERIAGATHAVVADATHLLLALLEEIELSNGLEYLFRALRLDPLEMQEELLRQRLRTMPRRADPEGPVPGERS